ncbi:MAG: cytochrome c [Alphaproteobacteria bacterium]|nr:cytochrome c [Alphaproteobacteria bacterium]
MSRNLKHTVLAALVLGAAWAHGVPAAASDARELIALPDQVRDGFLTEMRGHMGNLDDILAALAAGDFKQAANIADIRMDFGHVMWEGMMAQGMTADEALAMKEKMRAQGMGMGQGMGQGRGQGRGMGMGRFMPDDFRAMGSGLHEAAAAFAARARAAETPPTAKDFQDTMDALQGVTAVCRGCHETYRVR